MEYEGSIGLVSRKMKKNIAHFHVLGLFMAKTQAKKISVCDAPMPLPLPLNAKFVPKFINFQIQLLFKIYNISKI
jgi:hypothetical protein